MEPVQNFLLRRSLRSMGETRAIADTIDGLPDKRDGRADRIFSPRTLCRDDHPRILRILNAVELLTRYQRMASVINVKRMEMVTQLVLPPYLNALTRVGLLDDAVAMVYPYDEAAGHPNGTDVYVNKREIGYSRIIYSITEEGAAAQQVFSAVMLGRAE